MYFRKFFWQSCGQWVSANKNQSHEIIVVGFCQQQMKNWTLANRELRAKDSCAWAILQVYLIFFWLILLHFLGTSGMTNVWPLMWRFPTSFWDCDYWMRHFVFYLLFHHAKHFAKLSSKYFYKPCNFYFKYLFTKVYFTRK